MDFARSTGDGPVRSRSETLVRIAIWAACLGIFALTGVWAQAQRNATERTFPQSKAMLDKAVKGLQANLSGRLPSLEGFAKPGEHPLDRYQRGYYEPTVQVSANPSGGSVDVPPVSQTLPAKV